MKKRAIIIVLDSVGIGALPDAAEFGDIGAHTLGNINSVRPIFMPNLVSLGIGNIKGSRLPYNPNAKAAYGRAMETTLAKDTTSGHWEMAGFTMNIPFRTYPHGFPKEVMDEFEAKIGRGTLGNKVASGTVIINELGNEHVESGKPIVYTSADSVFQIAAHEEVVPLDELYAMCETAREMLVGDNLVGRVIARPFIGAHGNYTRTENRRDFALEPMEDTILDALTAKGMNVIGIGKIEDIFAKRGITTVDHTKNNHDSIDATLRYIRNGDGDFIFTNCVDFDMLYGHRNDVEGYAAALEYFDSRLPELLNALSEHDLLIITADHGCDPCHPGTDHTREYIPVLAYGHGVSSVPLGTLRTFADIGATVYKFLTGESWRCGRSFMKTIGL
ncbi:MAG: phosphopentomutase [Christensenellaceae bacterium]|nr:phosphopentomutase [Christensenellaceae bacterium]